MPTYHIDLVSGNDANTGVDWANAWRTITNGATAARIAPGDTIKVSKTSDPVSLAQNAQWTNLSPTVTLTSAITKHVAQAVGNTWTVSANVTGASSTQRKFGATAQQLNIAAGFTTGKIAYVAVDGGGTQDFSAYTKVSFWIFVNQNQAAGTLQLRLCSDAIGDVAVNTLSLPALPIANTYHCVEIDNGGALGANIQSVALYASVDPGTVNLIINNIIAGNNLTHKSLIGKNTAGETWWPIMNIDGTTIRIDLALSNNLTSRGYYGTTESVTIYTLNSFTLLAANGTSAANTLTDSGTPSGGRIYYSGGWNTGTNLQDGYTVFDGVNYGGYFIGINGPLNSIERICGVRYGQGYWNLSLGFNLEVNDSFSSCMGGNGWNISSGFRSRIDNWYSVCNGTASFNVSNAASIIVRNSKMLSNAIAGVYGYVGTKIMDSIIANNGTGGIRYDYILSVEDEVNAYLRHTTIDDTTEVFGISTVTAYVPMGMIWSFHHDNITDNNWGFSQGATANWQTVVFQGGDPGSWKIAITDSGRTSLVPVLIKIAEVGIEAGSLVTASVWCKKDHATNVGAEFFILGEDDNIAGIVADSATKANDTNWEQLTITFQSTEDGVVTLWGKAYYVAGNSNVYFGSISVTQ